MQSTTHLVFPPAAFYFCVRELIQDFKTDVMITAEALECLQTLCEDYLVKLMTDAYLESIHAKRLYLTTYDVQLARRERGERD